MISFGKNSSQDTSRSSPADSFPNNPWWADLERKSPSFYAFRGIQIRLLDDFDFEQDAAHLLVPVTQIAKKAVELFWFIPSPLRVVEVRDQGKYSLVRLRQRAKYVPEWTSYSSYLSDVMQMAIFIALARQYEYLFVEEQSLCEKYGVTDLHTPSAYAERCLLEYGTLPDREQFTLA